MNETGCISHSTSMTTLQDLNVSRLFVEAVLLPCKSFLAIKKFILLAEKTLLFREMLLPNQCVSSTKSTKPLLPLTLLILSLLTISLLIMITR